MYLWISPPFIIIMVGAMPQRPRGYAPVRGLRGLLSTLLPQYSYCPNDLFLIKVCTLMGWVLISRENFIDTGEGPRATHRASME